MDEWNSCHHIYIEKVSMNVKLEEKRVFLCENCQNSTFKQKLKGVIVLQVAGRRRSSTR